MPYLAGCKAMVEWNGMPNNHVEQPAAMFCNAICFLKKSDAALGWYLKLRRRRSTLSASAMALSYREFCTTTTVPTRSDAIYIPADVPAGTKAEAEAKRARRAKICFIMVTEKINGKK
jgi:hypothetical protein